MLKQATDRQYPRRRPSRTGQAPTLTGAIRILAFCAAASAHGNAVSSPENATADADLVLYNGAIYTVDSARPWVDSVAIRDGKYIEMGSREQVMALAGPATTRIDLDGKMAMPGINDAHSHPSQALREQLFQCKLPFAPSPAEIRETLAACIADNPGAEWITGGRWSNDFFEQNEIDSPRRWLDGISGDIAIRLEDETGHNAWVNSKALQLAGIDRDTPDPADGQFVREAGTRVPNGLLVSGASHAMDDIIPKLTAAEYSSIATEVIRTAHRLGITGFKEAQPLDEEIAAFAELDRENPLQVHVGACIRTPFGQRTEPLDYARYEEIRRRYSTDHVKVDCVKIVLDGVPTVTRTAAMLEPYAGGKRAPGSEKGSLNISPELLATDLVELDKRGFTVKIHTGGDRAVRVALDAIERARLVNGVDAPHHELAHAGFVHPDDIPRFSTLNAVADLSPAIWYPSAVADAIKSALGPRGEHYWPVRSLLESGAGVQAGSDWPSVVPSMNPWTGIEALVSRRNPYQDTGESLWPEQGIRLEQALEIYTRNGADALGVGSLTGSVQPGKSADLIVLDRNIFRVPTEDISETTVLMTLFAGRPVYVDPLNAPVAKR